jgi:hypothetical protein
VRTDNLHSLGPIVKIAREQPKCRDMAFAAAQLMIGERLTFQSEKEARVKDLLEVLANARCRNDKEKLEMAKAANALVAEADPLSVGVLLLLAKQATPCAEVALAAARKLLIADNLSLSCAKPEGLAVTSSLPATSPDPGAVATTKPLAPSATPVKAKPTPPKGKNRR